MAWQEPKTNWIAADVVSADDFNRIENNTNILKEDKVDKISSKGLSTNDYTTVEKNKLAGIANNANNYVHPAGTNPHGTTKGDVGLGNVENYAIATQAQAQAGAVNNAFMTPLRVNEAINHQIVFTKYASGTAVPQGTSSVYKYQNIVCGFQPKLVLYSYRRSDYTTPTFLMIRTNIFNDGISYEDFTGSGALSISTLNANGFTLGDRLIGGNTITGIKWEAFG